MIELLSKQMLLASTMCCFIVILAMIIDLIAGLYKAFLRKEVRKSEFLKRTGFKFGTYIGTMLIATGVDCMFYITKILQLVGLGIVSEVPFITILLGIFWCFVEYLSVREKADEKVHSTISRAEKLAQNMLSKEELINILAEAIKKAGK